MNGGWFLSQSLSQCSMYLPVTCSGTVVIAILRWSPTPSLRREDLPLSCGESISDIHESMPYSPLTGLLLREEGVRILSGIILSNRGPHIDFTELVWCTMRIMASLSGRRLFQENIARRHSV